METGRGGGGRRSVALNAAARDGRGDALQTKGKYDAKGKEGMGEGEGEGNLIQTRNVARRAHGRAGRKGGEIGECAWTGANSRRKGRSEDTWK